MAPARGRGPLPRPPPLPRPDARRKADAPPAPAVGPEPLLLPDPHPDQGRDHPLEVGGPGVPPGVDPPDPGPRRPAGGRGRARAVAPPRRGRGARSGGGGELPVGAAGRAVRLRRVRRAGPPAKPGRGGGLVAHRVLRAGPHVPAHPGVGAALPLGEPRDAGVLPLARAAGPPGLPGSHRLRRPPRHDAGAPGALRRRAHPEDRDPVAPARLHVYAAYIEPGWGPGGPRA